MKSPCPCCGKCPSPPKLARLAPDAIPIAIANDDSYYICLTGDMGLDIERETESGKKYFKHIRAEVITAEMVAAALAELQIRVNAEDIKPIRH